MKVPEKYKKEPRPMWSEINGVRRKRKLPLHCMQIGQWWSSNYMALLTQDPDTDRIDPSVNEKGADRIQQIERSIQSAVVFALPTVVKDGSQRLGHLWVERSYFRFVELNFKPTRWQIPEGLGSAVAYRHDTPVAVIAARSRA